jgi:cell division protein FtsB/cell division protein DivIC
MRRHPGLVVAVLAMLGVFALGAFPVRAYYAQLRQREELAARVRTLTTENGKLVDDVTRLQADDTVEQLARERYQLVRPGEEAYAILPEPPPPPAPAAAPPPPPPAPAGDGWLGRMWARVTSAF